MRPGTMGRMAPDPDPRWTVEPFDPDDDGHAGHDHQDQDDPPDLPPLGVQTPEAS